VTGANRGIGRECITQLLDRGALRFKICRLAETEHLAHP
jgi:NAD(P)-dependent dehydrogenase (short-subunit alcohol dehydrogenase family)